MIRRVRNNNGPLCECEEGLAAKLVAQGWKYADETKSEEKPAPARRGRPKKVVSTEE